MWTRFKNLIRGSFLGRINSWQRALILSLSFLAVFTGIFVPLFFFGAASSVSFVFAIAFLMLLNMLYQLHPPKMLRFALNPVSLLYFWLLRKFDGILFFFLELSNNFLLKILLFFPAFIIALPVLVLSMIVILVLYIPMCLLFLLFCLVCPLVLPFLSPVIMILPLWATCLVVSLLGALLLAVTGLIVLDVIADQFEKIDQASILVYEDYDAASKLLGELAFDRSVILSTENNHLLDEFRSYVKPLSKVISAIFSSGLRQSREKTRKALLLTVEYFKLSEQERTQVFYLGRSLNDFMQPHAPAQNLQDFQPSGDNEPPAELGLGQLNTQWQADRAFDAERCLALIKLLSERAAQDKKFARYINPSLLKLVDHMQDAYIQRDLLAEWLDWFSFADGKTKPRVFLNQMNASAGFSVVESLIFRRLLLSAVLACHELKKQELTDQTFDAFIVCMSLAEPNNRFFQGLQNDPVYKAQMYALSQAMRESSDDYQAYAEILFPCLVKAEDLEAARFLLEKNAKNLTAQEREAAKQGVAYPHQKAQLEQQLNRTLSHALSIKAPRSFIQRLTQKPQVLQYKRAGWFAEIGKCFSGSTEAIKAIIYHCISGFSPYEQLRIIGQKTGGKSWLPLSPSMLRPSDPFPRPLLLEYEADQDEDQPPAPLAT